MTSNRQVLQKLFRAALFGADVTTVTRVTSKADAAQYLAERLEAKHEEGTLTVNDLRAKLPLYLVQAIEYVTRPLASDTALDEQVHVDE